MKSASILALLLLVSLPAFSQPPDTLWTRIGSAGLNSESGLNAVHALPDGGFLGAGICCINLFHTFFTSAFAGRFNANGNEVWVSRFWGYPGTPFYAGEGAAAYDIKLVPDSGCIVAAGSGWGAPFIGARLLRLDDDGDSLWTMTATSDLWAERTMRAVCVTSDSGFAAIGDSAKVFRTNSSGSILWQTSLYPADLYAIVATPDSGFVVAGSDDVNHRYAFYLAKFNANGDTVWTHRYPFALGGIAAALCRTPNGGFLMAGDAAVPDAPLPHEAALVAADSGGNLLWTRIYNGVPPIVSMDRCAEGGNILLADRLLRINEIGDTLWTRTLPCDACAHARVIQTADSGYIVAGMTTSIFGFGSSSYLVKFHREGLPVSESPRSLLSDFRLSSFPNPFNPSTTISFSLPREAHARIAIFDILGREVAVLANDKFAIGEHQMTFNGSALPSGIYFARLQSGAMTETRKLLLLR